MESKAWLSKELQDKKVLCLACAHACKLNKDEHGICGVRKNKDGQLMLRVYGLASAMNIDPVEKKPLFHFLPDTSTFSLGTVGCNFKCKFCQNWGISQYPQTHNFQVFGHKLSPKKAVELALNYKCSSISYTYNEPVVFFEYTYDIAKLAKEFGLKNVYVTSGYETTKALEILSEVIDAMNIDLKSFNNNFYQNLCSAKLKPVLEAIKFAHKKGIWIEVTTLIIPSENDSEKELRDIAKFLVDVDSSIPWHVSAFHPDYLLKNKPPTPPETLIDAYHIGKEEGLKYVYVGNYSNEKFESTYCPKCNFRVIDRRGHLGQYVSNNLVEGKCPNCGYAVEGIWENPHLKV
jgi:pyruvate formate lyase activating enzyme